MILNELLSRAAGRKGRKWWDEVGNNERTEDSGGGGGQVREDPEENWVVATLQQKRMRGE